MSIVGKKRSIDVDIKDSDAKEPRTMSGLTSISFPVTDESFTRTFAPGVCKVCREPKDKCGDCRTCSQATCKEHLVHVRDAVLCTTCCAVASVCKRCKFVTVVADGKEEYCADCTKFFETKETNANIVVAEVSRLLTDEEFDNFFEGDDDCSGDVGTPESCEICSDAPALYCDACFDFACQKHLYKMPGAYVCATCFPQAKLCQSCNNGLYEEKYGSCDECALVEMRHREETQCSCCKKQVKKSDAAWSGRDGYTCFDCILLQKEQRN
jgi:hypothetical protein